MISKEKNKRISKYLTILALFCFSLMAYGSGTVESIRSEAITIEKWEVIDIKLKASGKIDNPFNIELTALFSNQNGEEQKISGFYNGGREWIIRFSASLPGEWTYTTSSDNKGLNKKSGTINVLDKNSKGQHGAVMVNPENPQHFSYEDGTPYFLLAFECDWIYALDYHNDQAIPKTDHLLGLLNENGFNQVVTTVYSYDVDWKRDPLNWPKDDRLKKFPQHEYGAPADIFPFLGTNKSPDYSALNIEYFQKFDRVVSSMHDKNIVCHLMIYVWNKLVSWPDMYSEADNMYFDYVVKRYQAYPNILWDISKEALSHGRSDQKYLLERIDRIRAADSYDRLVTVHDYGFCRNNSEAVDLISRQDWSFTLYNKMLVSTEEYKTKPVFNIEHGGYEESPYKVFTGSYTSPEVCLARNYQCIFSGAYSTYYWQAASWDVIIHNPFEQEDDFIKPRFEYYKHLSDFFTKHPFSEYKPFPRRNSAGYCMTGKKGDVLYYYPKGSYRIFGTWMFEDKPRRKYQWFNTLTGEYSDIMEADRWTEFVSPWYKKADAILIVE